MVEIMNDLFLEALELSDVEQGTPLELALIRARELAELEKVMGIEGQEGIILYSDIVKELETMI